MNLDKIMAGAAKMAGGETGPLNQKLGELEQSGSRAEADAVREDLARLAELNQTIKDNADLGVDAMGAGAARWATRSNAEKEKAAILAKYETKKAA